MATNGLVLIKPTSTAVTGGSASATINAGGSVTFTTCETLSLNGVFSSEYDNYIIDIRHVSSNNDVSFGIRMRSSGTDNSTANSYTRQYVLADNTTVSGLRSTGDIANIVVTDDSERSGGEIFLYGPNLTQPTAGRTLAMSGKSGAYLVDVAFTHNQSTAYDGASFIMSAGNFSGLIKVYGLVK